MVGASSYALEAWDLRSLKTPEGTEGNELGDSIGISRVVGPNRHDIAVRLSIPLQLSLYPRILRVLGIATVVGVVAPLVLH